MSLFISIIGIIMLGAAGIIALTGNVHYVVLLCAGGMMFTIGGLFFSINSQRGI